MSTHRRPGEEPENDHPIQGLHRDRREDGRAWRQRAACL
jgi:hypothetical protein